MGWIWSYAIQKDQVNVDFNIGNDVNLGSGGTVCGTSSVDYLTYADLTGSSKLIIEGTPGVVLRVMMNRQESNSGPLVEKNPTIGDDGKVEVDLRDLSYVHINAIKVNWGGSGSITSIKYDVPSDFKPVFKKILQVDINNAKLYNKFAYTDESFAILQTAITDGESVLNSDNIETLKTAGKKIADSISELTLKQGYSYIDTNQFKEYTSNENPDEGKSATPAYTLFKSSDNPYGDPNYLKWNELKEYDKLIITFSGNSKPRALMNRKTSNGNDGDNKESSEMLDMQPGKKNWSTEKYTDFDSENNVFTVNINSIVEDYGFARLHAIRYGYQESGIVTGIYLYTAPDQREPLRESLGNEIEKAKMYNAIAYTEGSFSALQTAINDGEQEKDNETATVASLTAAATAITAAIDSLELEEGYEKLTAEMFKEYTSYEEPGEGSETNGAYKLFETTDNPYGTGGSDNNRWADLAEYDKLIITFLGNDKPRAWFNRKVENGQDGTSIKDSNMLDLQEGNNKWSTKEYTTFAQEDNLNIFTVDLSKIKKDYNKFARLHGIKYGWNCSGIVTGMYLFKDPNPLGVPKEHLEQAIETAENCDPFLKSDATWNKLQDAIEAGKTALKDATTQKELEDATQAITDAIAGLELQEGYSELPSDIFKHYTSVENPGEGENTTCLNNIGTTTGTPYGDDGVSHLNWADLTNYDKLILTLSGDTKPRVMMNRMENQGPDAEKREDSKMLEMHPDYTRWSTTTYTTYDADKKIFTVKLKDIVDDYGFARLNSIKYEYKVSGIVTGMYLYKDATEEFNLSFNVDDPSHVVVKVNDETQNLKAGNNDVKVANRAKLFITSADKFKISSLTANNEEVALKNDTLTKTIVKAISFTIVTEDANPLQQDINKLNALIEKAKLYDDYLKEKTSWDILQAAITTAETEVAKANATKASLDNATSDLTTAIKELALVDDYYYLTPEMYKKYASVEEPGAGESAECAYVLFEATENAYGNSANNELEWADLSDYDSLIITTYGNDTKPLISLNRLVAGGQQASTKEASKMIDINPYTNDYKWSTEKYQKIEDNSDEDNKAYTYIVDLKQIVKDFGFARLHSITRSGWNVLNPSVSGLYLYKNPFVAVEGVALDKTESTMTLGETLTIEASVTPDDATDPTVTWSSSNENVATVDENGTVTATGVGTATITANCGTEEDGIFSASCAITCYPQTGDADWSSGITINDAIHIANYVVGKKSIPTGWTEANYDKFYKVGADVNNDKNVSISDASATVEIALKNDSEPAANAIALHSLGELADNLVTGGLNSSANGTTTVSVTLDNTMNYVALQADIYVPEGVNFDVKPGSRIADSHSFQYYRFDESHVRVAIYTFSGEAFADNNEPLFEIITDSYLSDPSDISLAKIFASDSDANEHVLGSRYAVATGVAALGFDSNAPVKVFDLNGRYISDKVEGLGKGIYIIRQGNNAKKVNIR